LSWFRVDANLVDHPKTRRLEQRLNDSRAGWYVIRAWSWLSRFCPTGHIQDADVTSFELACEWRGNPGELIAAFKSLGFVDTSPNGDLEWHDWDDLQGKVAEKAKKERDRKREYRARKKAEQEAEMSRGTASGRPALRNETERNGTVPLPLSAEPPADRAQVVFEHWRKVMKKSARTAFDDKRRKAVEARLSDGYTVDDLKRAVVGCAHTPHNMGQNDRGERYDDLELICRDAAHVDRFRARADAEAPTPPARPDDDVLREVLGLAREQTGDQQLMRQLLSFRWSRSTEGFTAHTEDPYFGRWLAEQHADFCAAASIGIDAPAVPEGAAA
jgi:hypothetical protein